MTITPRLLSALLGLSLCLAPRASATEVTLEKATIADLQQAFAKGTLTAEKLTSIYLGRIAVYDQYGPAINTVITLDPA